MDTSPQPACVRILVVDTHADFRSRVREFLHKRDGVIIVDETAEPAACARLTRQLAPDLLLFDWMLSHAGGLGVLQELGAACPETRIMIIADDINRSEMQLALRCGARGVLVREAAPSVLLAAVRAVMAGQYWFPRVVLGDTVRVLRGVLAMADFSPETRTPGTGLTRREADIVMAIAAGRTNKETAEQFSISENTVKHHLTSVFSKVGVSNRLELAVYALKHHLGYSGTADSDDSPPAGHHP